MEGTACKGSGGGGGGGGGRGGMKRKQKHDFTSIVISDTAINMQN